MGSAKLQASFTCWSAMRISHLSFLLIAALSIGSHAGADERSGSGRYCHQIQFGACRTVHGLYGIYVENNGIVDLRSNALLSSAGDEELDRMIRSGWRGIRLRNTR